MPSSSTSRMYVPRDSVNSEWTATWSRPLEDWEREQVRVLSNPLANASVIAEVLEKTVPLPESSRRYVGAGGGVGGEGRRGLQVVRHQSMGEMKAMRSVIPNVPPLPRDLAG